MCFLRRKNNKNLTQKYTASAFAELLVYSVSLHPIIFTFYIIISTNKRLTIAVFQNLLVLVSFHSCCWLHIYIYATLSINKKQIVFPLCSLRWPINPICSCARYNGERCTRSTRVCAFVLFYYNLTLQVYRPGIASSTSTNLTRLFIDSFQSKFSHLVHLMYTERKQKKNC